eukprot:6350701-Prymnesium_polylepis.1
MLAPAAPAEAATADEVPVNEGISALLERERPARAGAGSSSKRRVAQGGCGFTALASCVLADGR